MARMRSLKPEFWLDRKLARSLSRDERLLYLGLWNQADEHARAQADPRLVKGQVFPYDDDLTDDVIATMLKALEVAGVVQLYEVDGDPYLFLPNLAKHQRLEPHKVDSRHPSPPDGGEVDPDRPEPDPSGAQTNRGDAQSVPSGARAKHVAGSREHVAGSRGADESAQPRSAKPKTDRRGTRLPDDFAVTAEMRAWAHEQRWADRWINAVTERFCDYWRAQPGQRGVKTDWPATWRNWLRKEAENGHPTGAPSPSSLPSWELR